MVGQVTAPIGSSAVSNTPVIVRRSAASAGDQRAKFLVWQARAAIHTEPPPSGSARTSRALTCGGNRRSLRELPTIKDRMPAEWVRTR